MSATINVSIIFLVYATISKANGHAWGYFSGVQGPFGGLLRHDWYTPDDLWSPGQNFWNPSGQLWSPFILGNLWGIRRQFFNPFGHIWGYQGHFISPGHFWHSQGVLWGPPQPADDDSGSGEDPGFDETTVSPDSEVSDATTVSPDFEVPDETTVSPGGNTSQPADDGPGSDPGEGSGFDPGEGSGFDVATTDPPTTTSKSTGDGFGEESSLITTTPTGNDVEDGSGLMTYTTTIIPEEARQSGPGLEGDRVTTIPTDAFKLAAEEP